MDPHEALEKEQAAAAAVSALYFLCFFGSAFNVKLTGFRLYIPVSMAALVRGVSFACRAGFYSSGNMDLMAVNRALQAIGLGISVAMCCCFLIIWLRNAKPNYQLGKASAVVPLLCKLLVACIIILGPILGITSVGVTYSHPGDLLTLLQAGQVRKASVLGFVLVSSLITALTAFVTLCWVNGAAGAAAQQEGHPSPAVVPPPTAASYDPSAPQKPETQYPARGLLYGDQLIVLLLLSELCLVWSAAALVASLNHPQMLANSNVYYPVMVLPELLVAALWACPTLVARITLGGRYWQWRREQRQQKVESGKRQVELATEYDAEAVAVDGEGNGTKGLRAYGTGSQALRV